MEGRNLRGLRLPYLGGSERPASMLALVGIFEDVMLRWDVALGIVQCRVSCLMVWKTWLSHPSKVDGVQAS